MLILAIISLNTKRFHPMTYKKNETKELIEQIKYLENELRSSKATQAEYEMLKNIIKYSPDWIYWKDKNSVHLGSNEQFAKAAGLSSSQEMVGKTDYDLPWCERAQKYRLDDQEVIVSGTPKINIEDKVLVCDKKEVIVISNKVPLKNAQGDIIGILGIATDITNQKKTAQDLEKATVINEAYINVASADVLSSLVRHNPGAFMKYALLTLLQLCLELMPILLKLQAGQSPLGHEMAIYAYDHKTKTLDQVNLSNAKRLDSEAQITLARHEHALVEKEQFANRQEFDSQVVKQKIMQDLENEQLRQELNELKRQTSAYARAQHQFTQSFAHATDQFVNRVVVPTVNMAVKPFATSTIQTTSTSVPEDQSAGAKVFKFGDPIDQGVKAAS